MQRYRFAQDVIYTWHAGHLQEILRAIEDALQASNLPPSKSALILIKPNLNNDLNALTGNSTDLRLLGVILTHLQKRGYSNLVVADGPNIGINRKPIDVFARLGVRALTERHRVQLVNLNHEPGIEVDLTTSKALIARICLEADFLINVAKIKTHAEAGMSCCLKNLIGCVVGQNKKRVHDNLSANIVRLNEIIKPDLHVVDGLVAMEGNGPGDGEPRRLDLLLSGRDPFLIDLIVAHLVGLDGQEIEYLRIAKEEGYLSPEDIEKVAELEELVQLEKPPPRNPLIRILEHSLLEGIRDLTRPLHSRGEIRALLYRVGILQDVYEFRDAKIDKIYLNAEECDGCGHCLHFCPLALPITEPGFGFVTDGCLGCLYCVHVCPRQAIVYEGELGYLSRHLTRYGEQMRRL
jgi:uncharacterized protein (DUF362 family)/Pyruvate/2-oxoacid:ferredoxin oxidoreductase delta subunit